MSTVLRAPRGGVCSSSGRTASSRASSTAPSTAAPSRVAVALAAPTRRVPARASLRCFASVPASERPGEVSCRAECGCFVVLNGMGGAKRARARFPVLVFFPQAAFYRERERACRSLCWVSSLVCKLSLSLSPALFLPTDRAPAPAVSSIENAEERLGREAGARTLRDVQSTNGPTLSATFSPAWCPLVSKISRVKSRSAGPPSNLVRPRSARAGDATRHIPAVERVFGARAALAGARGSSR